MRPCRHSRQKELRIIDTLEPVMNQHRLVVNEDLVREDTQLAKDDPKYSLFYQLTRITRERGSLRHDDRLDALAMAVAYWVESVAQDELQAKNRWKDREIDQMLQDFLGGVVDPFGNKLTGSSLGSTLGSFCDVRR